MPSTLRTRNFTTDAAPGLEPIQAIGVGRRIRIREKPPAGAIPYVGGTAGFKIFGIRSAGTPDPSPITRPAGDEFPFTSALWYAANETVGFITALSGTMTMELIEDAGELHP